MYDYTKIFGFLVILLSCSYSQSEVIYAFGGSFQQETSQGSFAMSMAPQSEGIFTQVAPQAENVFTQDNFVQYSLGILAEFVVGSEEVEKRTNFGIGGPNFTSSSFEWEVPNGVVYEIVSISANGNERVLYQSVGTGVVEYFAFSQFKLNSGYQIIRGKAGVYSWSRPYYKY